MVKADRMLAQKCAAVRNHKDKVIQDEIMKIGERDNEARRLER